VWEVRDAAGRHRGLFFGDYFARPSKHSGAWMTRLRDREKLKGDIRPLVANVMNFSKARPTLPSFDDAKTLFHEFGHALHGLRGGAQDRKTHSIQGKHCAAKVLRPAVPSQNLLATSLAFSRARLSEVNDIGRFGGGRRRTISQARSL
jgi:Zn-dependent oligopeptidase